MCSDGFSLTPAVGEKKRDRKGLWGPERCFLDLKTGSHVWVLYWLWCEEFSPGKVFWVSRDKHRRQL